MPIATVGSSRRSQLAGTPSTTFSSTTPQPADPDRAVLADALMRVREAAGAVGIAPSEADSLARSGGFLLGWLGSRSSLDADVDVQVESDDEDTYLRFSMPCAESLSPGDLDVLRALAGGGSLDLALDGQVLVGVLQQPRLS